MTGPDRKRTSRPSNEGSQRRTFRKPHNRGQRRTSNRSQSRPTIYIRKGILVFLLDILQHGGVDKAVILPVATKPEHIKYNEWYGEVGKKFPRIIPFGLIHPDNDASELDKFPELGLKGIKIQPNATRTYPDDKKYYSLANW